MLKKLLVSVAVLAGIALFAGSNQTAYSFAGKTDKEIPVYAKGEKVELKQVLLDNGKPVTAPQNIRFEITSNGVAGKRQYVNALEASTVFSTEDPGWYYFSCLLLDDNRRAYVQKNVYVEGRLGILVAPEEIKPAVEAPADFDAFWKAQREKLDKVPLKVSGKDVPVTGIRKGRMTCKDVKINCAGDAPVSGYLAMPVNAAPKSLPAVVTFDGAGVYSSVIPERFGHIGISFKVNAHGIENGREPAFYRELDKGKLKGYQYFGCEDREKCYFLGMYLRVMRALDYVKSLPEWDGKTLIVRGGSQGGAQAVAAAALDPQVTFCMASVPALCDLSAAKVNRKPGWPWFYGPGCRRQEVPGVAEAVPYFDTVNFAARLRCETFFIIGLQDNVCPPSGIYAAYNSIPDGVTKNIVIKADRGHNAGMYDGDRQIFDILLKRERNK